MSQASLKDRIRESQCKEAVLAADMIAEAEKRRIDTIQLSLVTGWLDTSKEWREYILESAGIKGYSHSIPFMGFSANVQRRIATMIHKHFYFAKYSHRFVEEITR